MTKDTWFDAFFRAVTSSPEFKSVVEKDWKWDFQKSLKDMEKNIKKASEITDSFKEKFDTPEAREIWENYTYTPYMTKNEESEEDKKSKKLDIQYFENKNPKTWWFKWVAWMEWLKNELTESFIKPLKFKFLVQKLENEAINSKPSPLEENKVWKNELYKQIHEAYKKFNVSIPTWLLFYWPPWTWKTFITKKLAQELWAWLIKKSAWEFWSSYIHQTSQNIRNFFEQAKLESEKWPIILFLDEIDSLLSKRTNNIDSNKAEEVSQFLQEFNALEDAPNLIVIAATNRPDHLDSAILRSWRLDKKIYIWPPDFQARKELFQINIEKIDRPHKDLDYEKLAELTKWYVASDIETICDEVARDASQSILNLANLVDTENPDIESIKDKITNSVITMELLKKAIKETDSSVKFVDMSVYENFLDITSKTIKV
jgi:transitional endoplasmic reticulum ATPase